jgi:hypothetical protein
MRFLCGFSVFLGILNIASSSPIAAVFAFAGLYMLWLTC